MFTHVVVPSLSLICLWLSIVVHITYIKLHFIWQTLLSKATYKVVQFKVIKQPNTPDKVHFT